MELTGSSALVTGAASGLGAATAAALAGAGAAVVGLDLAVAWDRAPAPPAGVIALPGDVTAPEQVQTAVERAGRDGPLRVAVNCAGLGTAGRILSRSGVHELDMFARVIQVNLVGTFNVLRLAAAAMADTDPLDADGQRGLIVNTASVAAFDGQIGQAAYASSKGGVVGLTLPAARDLAQYGIRVVTIAPGIIDTPMMDRFSGGTPEGRQRVIDQEPIGRMGRPEEIASAVLWLCSDSAAFTIGHALVMDGGQTVG